MIWRTACLEYAVEPDRIAECRFAVSTLRAVGFEELGALVRGLDLAQLARREVGIEDIERFIVVKNSAVWPPGRVVGNVRPLRRR